MDTSFIKLYNWMFTLNIPPTELVVYAIIYSYTKSGGKYWGSGKTTADRLNISERKYYKAIKALKDKGYIVKDGQGYRSNEVNKTAECAVFTTQKTAELVNKTAECADQTAIYADQTAECADNNNNYKTKNIREDKTMTEQKTQLPPPFEKVLNSFNLYYQTSLQTTPHNIKIAEQINKACGNIQNVNILFYYTSQKQTLKNRDFGEIAGILKKDPSLLDEAIEFCKKAWDNIVKQKREQERAEQAKLEKQKRDQQITEESKNYAKYRFFVEDVLKEQVRFKVLIPATQISIITEIMDALPETATEEEILDYYLKNCLNRKEE